MDIDWKAVATITTLVMGTIFFGAIAQYALQGGQFSLELLASLYVNFIMGVLSWYIAGSMGVGQPQLNRIPQFRVVLKAVAAITGLLVAFIFGIKLARIF